MWSIQLRQVTQVSFSQFLCDCGPVPDPLSTGSQQEHHQNESVWSCPVHLHINLLSTERTCLCVCQRSFTCPLEQLSSVGVELQRCRRARRCVRLHADRLPLKNNYLLWNLHVTTHPDPPPFVFVKAAHGLIAAQLFASTQEALHVFAAGHFSLFAVSGKRQMCSRLFQVYPTKLANAACNISVVRDILTQA